MAAMSPANTVCVLSLLNKKKKKGENGRIFMSVIIYLLRFGITFFFFFRCIGNVVFRGSVLVLSDVFVTVCLFVFFVCLCSVLCFFMFILFAVFRIMFSRCVCCQRCFSPWRCLCCCLFSFLFMLRFMYVFFFFCCFFCLE